MPQVTAAQELQIKAEARLAYFITGSDPVEVGLVATLNHPGSNVTRVSLFTSLLVAKRLELVGRPSDGSLPL